MNNEEKIREILDCENCKKQLFIGGVKCPPTCTNYNDLMKIAQWKDEQLESKLMQIIILAQQGYTSGATDEMILKHCKEIINENNEHNTTTKD